MDPLEKINLKWDDFRQNISSTFNELREDIDFTDVTLACEDRYVEVHKIVIASGSNFFRSLLKRNKNPHPWIYLRGIQAKDLEAIVDFFYKGEVSIVEADLNEFLVLANEIELKGLTTKPNIENKSKKIHNSRKNCKNNLKQSKEIIQDSTISTRNAVGSNDVTDFGKDIHEIVGKSKETTGGDEFLKMSRNYGDGDRSFKTEISDMTDNSDLEDLVKHKPNLSYPNLIAGNSSQTKNPEITFSETQTDEIGDTEVNDEIQTDIVDNFEDGSLFSNIARDNPDKSNYIREESINQSEVNEKVDGICTTQTETNINTKTETDYTPKVDTNATNISLMKLVDNLWTCIICEKSFKEETSLRIHVEIHVKNRKSRSPPIGPETEYYAKKHSLMKLVGNSWTCTVCGISYTKRISLITHVRNHLEGLSHQCQNCGNVYRYIYIYIFILYCMLKI